MTGGKVQILEKMNFMTYFSAKVWQRFKLISFHIWPLFYFFFYVTYLKKTVKIIPWVLSNSSVPLKRDTNPLQMSNSRSREMLLPKDASRKDLLEETFGLVGAIVNWNRKRLSSKPTIDDEILISRQLVQLTSKEIKCDIS